MSRHDAAIVIQKNYRRYTAQKNFLMIKKDSND